MPDRAPMFQQVVTRSTLSPFQIGFAIVFTAIFFISFAVCLWQVFVTQGEPMLSSVVMNVWLVSDIWLKVQGSIGSRVRGSRFEGFDP